MNVSVVTNRIYNAHCFPTFDAEIHKYRFGFSASKARTLRSVEAVENLGAFLHMGSTWVLQNSSTEVSSASDMSRSLPSPPHPRQSSSSLAGVLPLVSRCTGDRQPRSLPFLSSRFPT
ncbi:hypothetical protein POX_g08851 [Penicillium oxalicum]|uniref:hypothetical protein n=1 Tax=Penicillium oxalicum TaxID=69781 RepID=UPI0020B7B8F6|nr:hypothetical protein POX_g08851 [Penicillium oxalicum]KAI2786465.1 hypothetical protein POX_g08851 [Penicillium oxalicum]